MRILAYVLLMLLFSPLLVVGFPFSFVPVLLRRGKVSGTAHEAFTGRLIYHLLGTRPDPAAERLAAGLPGTNSVALLLMLKPLALASRLSGFTPTVFSYPPPHPAPMGALIGVRCEFLDRALRLALPEIPQVVILGAGFDTRAYGLPEGHGIQVFEVDRPGTQAKKKAAVERASLDAAHVRFVPCDFNGQSWLEALADHGFDAGRPAFVLWEGVSMYLDEPAVRSTLRTVSTLAPGSRIAGDFFSREWLEGTFAGRMACFAIRVTYGEAFRFGFRTAPDFEGSVSAYLGEQGLTLDQAVPFGAEGVGKAPRGGVFLAVNRA